MFGRKKAGAEPDRSEQTARKQGASGRGGAQPDGLERAYEFAAPIVETRIGRAARKRASRNDLAKDVRAIVDEVLATTDIDLNLLDIRNLVTRLINRLVKNDEDKAETAPRQAAAVQPPPGPKPDTKKPDERAIDSYDKFVLDDAPMASAPSENPALRKAGKPAAGNSKSKNAGEAPEPGFGLEPMDAPEPALNDERGDPIQQAKNQVQPVLMERIDISVATRMPRAELAHQVAEIVAEILFEKRLRLNLMEQRNLITMLINDMLGLGPLEPLLADDTITDIMVNGADQVYIERAGKLELSDVRFQNDAQVMNIATRIVTWIGRRIDESSPLVDARLADGSRVNIIIPPLAIDGPTISIRKFSKKSITLEIMARQNNLSPAMATLLKIAARCRLNILISGGTGSGKTTLLNAMSRLIEHGERIVTIEDAAELQLQQPHVVRLETRPANLEGVGQITMRDLVKNSLRMRPDRIILGEVRGEEAVDMLQAMNTGHEGSMCTVHANRPREALTRLENMIGLAGINLPAKAVRTQIVDAIDLVIQISRMRDGMRRITSVTEVTGMEGDVIITQELFSYEFQGEDENGNLRGNFTSTGLRPYFMPKAEYFGLGHALLEAIG